MYLERIFSLSLILLLFGCGSSPAPTIKNVESFNIKKGRGASSYDLAEYFSGKNNIVIALQEIRPSAHLFGFYSVVSQTGDDYGIALLSDRRFNKVKRFVLDRCGGIETRAVVAGLIDNIWYLNSHLSHIDKTNKCQIDSLINIVSSFDGSLILMGDMNFNKDSAEYYKLLNATGLIDTGGDTYSFSVLNPRTKLDFIFSRDVEIKNSVDTRINLSDHYPVIGELL